MAKEQDLSKITSAISGISYGKAPEESQLKRIANALEGVTKASGKSVVDMLDNTSATEVTHDELVALRDAGKLIPGALYRITDYVATTTQEGTKSANHPFDIIVRADSSNVLNENAFAAIHEGDDYFSKYSCKLEAWELKYCLDNDNTRFAWADEENGKGVIYRMIDEFNNDCPYDFKNIQFKRKISLSSGYPKLDIEAGEDTWVYTFTANSYNISNDEWSELKDGSLESPYGHQSDEDGSTYHDNTIEKFILLYDDEEDYTKCGKQYLNNNVFLGYWEEVGSSKEEYPYYYAYCCYGNKLKLNCINNTFGINCKCNIFGNDCKYNIFRNNCYNNIFKDNCKRNIFKGDCYNNVFEEGCYNNTLDYAISNKLGIACLSNIINSNCEHNTFENYCFENVLQEGIRYTTIFSQTGGKTITAVNDRGCPQFAGVDPSGIFNIFTLDDILTAKSVILRLNTSDFPYSTKIEISKDLYDKAAIASLLMWNNVRTLPSSGKLCGSIYDNNDNNLSNEFDSYITGLFNEAWGIYCFGRCSVVNGVFDFSNSGELCAFFREGDKYYFYGVEM